MNVHHTDNRSAKPVAAQDVRRQDTGSAVTPRPAKAGVIYICPMHSRIRQDHSGNCPICGMTLELLGTSQTAANPFDSGSIDSLPSM